MYREPAKLLEWHKLLGKQAAILGPCKRSCLRLAGSCARVAICNGDPYRRISWRGETSLG
jgi:hypothetical protein